MNTNEDKDRLRRLADSEDGCPISVGGSAPRLAGIKKDADIGLDRAVAAYKDLEAARIARLRGIWMTLQEMYPELSEKELVEKMPLMLTTSKEMDEMHAMSEEEMRQKEKEK